MKLATQLPLAFCSVLLVSAAAGFGGITLLNRSIDTYARVVEVDDANDRLASRALYDFKVQVQDWKDVLLRGKDPELLERYWKGFEEQEQRVAAAAGSLVERLPEGEARDAARSFASAHARMGESYRKGLEAFKAAGMNAAAGDAAVKGIDREPSKLLTRVSERLASENEERSAEALRVRQTANRLSIGLMVLIIAVGGIGGVLLSRRVLRQLGGEPEEARALLARVAAGDLGVRIRLRPGDQSSLLASLAATLERLGETIGRIHSAATTIAGATRQIAAGNQDLSARTEEQASSLEESASAMEELSGTVGNNAENAREADRIAAELSDLAGQSGQAVSEMVGAMNDISGSSLRIRDIIQVIDGIAFQTNILALNAAVEAARAGEQGRGFAVVASEVRQLAQRSADAAREIKELIGASADRVASGVSVAGAAGKQNDDTIGAIGRMTRLVAEIAAAAKEQAAGVEQVTQAVSQMDQVTQQNAALVEEAAAAAASLDQQARDLLQAIAFFTVPGARQAANTEGFHAIPGTATHAAAGRVGALHRAPGRAGSDSRVRRAA